MNRDRLCKSTCSLSALLLLLLLLVTCAGTSGVSSLDLERKREGERREGKLYEVWLWLDCFTL